MRHWGYFTAASILTLSLTGCPNMTASDKNLVNEVKNLNQGEKKELVNTIKSISPKELTPSVLRSIVPSILESIKPPSVIPGITPTPTVTPSTDPAIRPASIVIVPGSLTLNQGNSNFVRAFVKDAQGNNLTNAVVRWESKEPSIARVDQNGEVTGVSSGHTTQIKAICENISAEIDVTVGNIDPPPPPDIQHVVAGKVVDDSNADIDGATITALSLDASKPCNKSATTNSGSYMLTGVPCGVNIQFTVTKAGYTKRIQTKVFAAGATDDLNFGQDSTGAYYALTALSDKPEVTAITPNFNSTGVSPSASFTLKFSEPMDKVSVEDNFIIRNRENLTFTMGGTYNGAHNVVYNKSDYDLSWNGAKDEMTATPKNSQYIPTDKDSAKIPSYYVSFSNQFNDTDSVFSRPLNAARATAGDDGITPTTAATDGPFRVDGSSKCGSPFTITTDTTAPKMDAVYINSATELKIRFNEPMRLNPVSFTGVFGDTDFSPGWNHGLISAVYEFRIGDGFNWDTAYVISDNDINTMNSVIDGSDLTNRTVKFQNIEFKGITAAGPLIAQNIAIESNGAVTNAVSYISTTVGNASTLGTVVLPSANATNFKVGQRIVVTTNISGALADCTAGIIANITADQPIAGSTTIKYNFIATNITAGTNYNLSKFTGTRLQARIKAGVNVADPAGNDITVDADKKADVVISL